MTNPRDDLIRLMSQAVGLAGQLSADLLAEAADIMADIQVPMRRVQCLTWRAYGILAPAGPQARAGFQPGQPRDEYGRWSETGAGLLEAGRDPFEGPDADESYIPAEVKDRMRIVYQAVMDLGGDPANVDYGGEGYPFEVNGQQMYAAASFNQDTMVIKVYDNALLHYTDEQLRGTVAHEQTHYMYERIQEQMEREGWAMDKLPADAIVYNADGTVVDEYAERFPLHALLYKYEQGATMRQLKKEDGVTSYSTEYWKALEAQMDGSAPWNARNISFDLCLNETLAEISALRAEGGNTKAIADILAQYHADLLAAFAAIPEKDR